MIRLSSKQILCLLILCGAVILHATMWPYNFRFDWGSVPARLLSATDLPFADGRLAEKKDIVLNVILFLPFGVLLFLNAPNRSRQIGPSYPPPFSGCFSVSTKRCGAFSHHLWSTSAQHLGALLGAIAAWTSLRMVEQTTEEESAGFRRNALFLSLAAYSCAGGIERVHAGPGSFPAELAVRGRRSSLFVDRDATSKAAGPILYVGVLAYLTAEWAMLSVPGFRSASTYFIVFLAGSAFTRSMK
jgi:hypothetical protein